MSAARVIAPRARQPRGDHTDHVGGWCFPIAVDRGITMRGEHRSPASDLGSSTDEVDERFADLRRHRGVLGARITGGGWGGAVIALARPGALDDHPGAVVVTPSAGAGAT